MGDRAGIQVFVGTCDAVVGSHGMRQDVVLWYYVEVAVNKGMRSGRLCLPGDGRSQWGLCDDEGLVRCSLAQMDTCMLQSQG